MSRPIEITSTDQFDGLLRNSRVVVIDFYAEWCVPCKQVAPIYEQFSEHLSILNLITFVKVNVDKMRSLSARYRISVMPTFMIFKQGQVFERFQGADTMKVQAAIQDLIAETQMAAKSGQLGLVSTFNWRIGEIPKGFDIVTDQVDVKGLDISNAHSEYGSIAKVFEDSIPSTLLGQNKAVIAKDWVESDADDQLMLFAPFQSTLKIHSIQITSLPNLGKDKSTKVMRPKTVQLYPNLVHILGFEEAEQCPATQVVTLTDDDWDASGTATLKFRFVKFQNVSSLGIFISDGFGEGERIRIDRIRIIGEVRERRDLGKLEKFEDE